MGAVGLLRPVGPKPGEESAFLKKSKSLKNKRLKHQSRPRILRKFREELKVGWCYGARLQNEINRL